MRKTRWVPGPLSRNGAPRVELRLTCGSWCVYNSKWLPTLCREQLREPEPRSHRSKHRVSVHGQTSRTGGRCRSQRCDTPVDPVARRAKPAKGCAFRQRIACPGSRGSLVVPANDAEPRRPPMASFDATSSAVPDSLLLARQADRLARQATNTVMQDTISRPALGDSSNTLSVEALVKQGGRAKAPRRVCHGCVALRNEGEALKREVLRLRSGMKAMQARLEALETAAVRAATARAARRERARSAKPPAGPPPAVVAASSPPKPPAAAPGRRRPGRRRGTRRRRACRRAPRRRRPRRPRRRTRRRRPRGLPKPTRGRPSRPCASSARPGRRRRPSRRRATRRLAGAARTRRNGRRRAARACSTRCTPSSAATARPSPTRPRGSPASRWP